MVTMIDPIDQTYGAVVASLPAELRSVARSLPHALGLTADPNAGWAEFIRQPATRDLPGLAARGLGKSGGGRISARALELFRNAHHCAGFYGLLIDRLADGQVRPKPGMRDVRRSLLGAWTRALAEAMGDADAAHSAIAQALRAWARGVRAQRSLANGATLLPDAYVAMSRDRLLWTSTSTACLLGLAAPREQRLAFLVAYDRYILAMQCIDDARDAAEDERLLGASIPRALGLPASGLVRAATLLALEALFTAAAGGFEDFARSVLPLLVALETRRSSEAALEGDLAALALVEAARRPPAPPSSGG
jgi:hypothetical protein